MGTSQKYDGGFDHVAINQFAKDFFDTRTTSHGDLILPPQGHDGYDPKITKAFYGSDPRRDIAVCYPDGRSVLIAVKNHGPDIVIETLRKNIANSEVARLIKENPLLRNTIRINIDSQEIDPVEL